MCVIYSDVRYWPWDSLRLIQNGYRGSFPGVKLPGHGINDPPPSSAEVKEKVKLYFYSPFGPSWPFLGRTYLVTTLGIWIIKYCVV